MSGLFLSSFGDRLRFSVGEMALHRLKYLVVARLLGEICSLVWIDRKVIEFFARGPKRISVTRRTNSLAEFLPSRNDRIGDLLALRVRIIQHRRQASALKFLRRSHIAKFGQCWKQIDEFDKTFT